MSAVKRARKLLDIADKRALGRISFEQKSSDKHLLRVMAQEKERKQRNQAVEVIFKATGKAIEKGLQLALYFSQQDDIKMRVATGTVTAVDDIVEKEDLDDVQSMETEYVPETQIRRMSMLEVGIKLK
jgi:hypothetical protein